MCRTMVLHVRALDWVMAGRYKLALIASKLWTMLTCVLRQLVMDRDRIEGLIVLHLITDWLQMMPSSCWHLLSMELDWSRRRILVLSRRTNLVEHGHVVMLVLHARPGFTLLTELLLRDATWQWSYIFFSFTWMRFRAADFWTIRALHVLYHMRCRSFNLFALTLTTVSIALKRGLLRRYHVHLTAHILTLLLLDPIHALQTKVRRLNVSVWPLVNCLIVCNLVLLHGRAKSTLWTLRPLILHLLKLVLTGEFIKVAVRVTDRVSVRSVPWNPIRTVFTLPINYILCQTFLCKPWIVAITDTHQLLYQLFFCYFFTVNQLLQ